MSYEIELKFPLTDPENDQARIRQALEELNATSSAELTQCDRYFGHPMRDFGQTHEAFRIRQSNEKTRLTYKGPILNAETKTRREIEISLADGPNIGEEMAEMLKALSFTEVRTVRKTRTPYHLTWQNRTLEVTLDHVEQLGWFLEIEIIAEEEKDCPVAQNVILDLAKHWKLENAERRSYLNLILDQEN